LIAPADPFFAGAADVPVTLIRGAAGAALLNAELLKVEGYLT